MVISEHSRSSSKSSTTTSNVMKSAACNVGGKKVKADRKRAKTKGSHRKKIEKRRNECYTKHTSFMYLGFKAAIHIRDMALESGVLTWSHNQSVKRIGTNKPRLHNITVALPCGRAIGAR